MTDTTAAPAAAGAEGDADTTGKGAESTSDESLPEWAREKLTKANAEAAKYRTEKNSAVEAAKLELAESHKAELEKVSAEKASLQETVDKTALELAKLRAALSVGVPSEQAAEFADLLRGTTDVELKAHAEKVKGLFGATQGAASAIDPTQGVTGSVKAEPGPGLNRLRAAYGA